MTTNELLIDGLTKAEEIVGSSKFAFKRGDILLNGDVLSYWASIPNMSEIHISPKSNLADNIILPGLLRYLAGEMGWEMQVMRYWPYWNYEYYYPENEWGYIAWKKETALEGSVPEFEPGSDTKGDENDIAAYVTCFHAIVEKEYTNDTR